MVANMARIRSIIKAYLVKGHFVYLFISKFFTSSETSIFSCVKFGFSTHKQRFRFQIKTIKEWKARDDKWIRDHWRTGKTDEEWAFYRKLRWKFHKDLISWIEWRKWLLDNSTIDKWCCERNEPAEKNWIGGYYQWYPSSLSRYCVNKKEVSLVPTSTHPLPPPGLVLKQRSIKSSMSYQKLLKQNWCRVFFSELINILFLAIFIRFWNWFSD